MSATETTESNRGIRRTVRGVVTSNKMDKTVVVMVERKVRDKHFHKFVKKQVKYYAHDERNENNIGDLVELVEARPYSKSKRWRVARVIVKAREGAK